MDRQGLVGFGRNGVFRRQMYQHRGSGLDIVSFWFCCAEQTIGTPQHTKKLYTIDLNIISLSVGGQWKIFEQAP